MKLLGGDAGDTMAAAALLVAVPVLEAPVDDVMACAVEECGACAVGFEEANDTLREDS